MRIVFIASKLNFRAAGGSVEELDLIIRTLQKLGNAVTVVTAFSRANDIPLQLPYNVIEENISSERLLGIQKEVFQLLKKYSEEADVFHLDHLFLYGAGLYRRLGGSIPVVVFFNQYLTCFPDEAPSLFLRDDNFFNRFKKKIRFYVEKHMGVPIANGTDIFSFVSPTMKAMYGEFGLNGKNQNLVVGDPIDFRKIMTENHITEDSYRQRNKHEGPITIFYSSRMSSGKGFDLLLDGFSKIRNKNNFRLILGGSGPQESLVHKMVHDLNLQKYVELPGWVSKEKLYDFYKKADIFVQVGWWPVGTSISLTYAMAFGVPSILPGGGGLEWQGKKCALYVKNGNPYDLAEKIEKLGSDYALREELSRNGYLRLADEEMNYEKNIKNLYEKMKIIVGQNNRR